jgi:membrane-bound lytic murein transglycosylase D
MKFSFARSSVFLLLVTTLILTGCSSMNTGKTDPQLTTDAETMEALKSEHYVPVESEEVLHEELSALERVGAWEEGQPEKIREIEPEVTFDFPVTMNKQVRFYLDTFQHRQKKYFKRWLARSGRYLPSIQKELARAGLPKDLAYLAMIESGFNPSAYSRARAVGLWQFIKGTGRNYGLRIDRWVDERRDPEKATRAAIAYLGTLYAEFDDWYLAVASYNAGEGKIRKGIKRYKTRNFWELARHRFLRLETKRYVPKLIAAILIAKEPEKYGFTDIAYHTPVAYDLVAVPAGTDLHAVATAAKSKVGTIRELNNELRRNQTPPGRGSYQVKVPLGSRDLVAKNLKRLHPVVSTDWKTHVVRRGDTLRRICRRYSLNTRTLLKANNLRSARLRPGQRLRIPYRTTRYVLLNKGETLQAHYARMGKNNPLVLHRLKRGETLSKLARQYQVPVSLIKQWNGIHDVRKIRAGQHIALYVDGTKGNGKCTPAGKEIDRNRQQILSLNDSKKWAPDQNTTPALTWYQVRHGDSLWTIARKFQVSAHDIRRWNRLRSNLIHPGTKLIIRKV